MEWLVLADEGVLAAGSGGRLLCSKGLADRSFKEKNRWNLMILAAGTGEKILAAET